MPAAPRAASVWPSEAYSLCQGACRPWGLSRDKILRKTDEFSSVFRFKQVSRGVCLDLFVMPNDLSHARLGLAVPRRVVRLASRRNRLKRLMREMFRLRQDLLPGLDVVARVKAICPEEQFKSEFLRLLDDCRPAERVERSANPS
ncbi:MAG TPA: ribonuclease P protein component [Thiobacillaceae bacterium]|nr:ribonuclease P protein component [Thiobacillaceae bacterium]